MKKFGIICLSASLMFLQPAQAQVKVIDGDSIFIGKREIRLSGIDAPEYKQPCYNAAGKAYPCGELAFRALKKMVDDSLECRSVTTDRYKREVAVCYVGGEDINRKMVSEGWAVAYTRYSDDYAPAEKEAQRAKRGIWQGRFMKPELYRALKR
ncbi:putative staphylococcal nuclease-like protein [Proteobacteria bacterium CAG:495]|jgi:nuclease-like protein|nr:putative staphylococcal nuclease-like protein [Proteobacteria bacterium CAG:495]